MRAAVDGEPGTILVILNNVRTGEELLPAIARRLGVSSAAHEVELAVEHALSDLVRHQRAQQGARADWVPTLVVKVDGHASSDALRTLLEAIKDLCGDKHLCTPFLLCSDVHAAMIPSDLGGRLRRLVVEDFSLDEVHRFAEAARSQGKLQALMASRESREDFVRTRGSRAWAVKLAATQLPGVSSSRDASTNMWNCRQALADRPAVRSILSRLAREHAAASAKAAAGGTVPCVGDASLNAEELGLSTFHLAQLMTPGKMSQALHLRPDRVSFIDPVAASQVGAIVAREAAAWK